MECSAALAYKEVPSARLLLPAAARKVNFRGAGSAAGIWSISSSGGRGGRSLGFPRSGCPFTRSAWMPDGVDERKKRERTEAEGRSETGSSVDERVADFPLWG